MGVVHENDENGVMIGIPWYLIMDVKPKPEDCQDGLKMDDES